MPKREANDSDTHRLSRARDACKTQKGAAPEPPSEPRFDSGQHRSRGGTNRTSAHLQCAQWVSEDGSVTRRAPCPNNISTHNCAVAVVPTHNLAAGSSAPQAQRAPQLRDVERALNATMRGRTILARSSARAILISSSRSTPAAAHTMLRCTRRRSIDVAAPTMPHSSAHSPCVSVALDTLPRRQPRQHPAQLRHEVHGAIARPAARTRPGVRAWARGGTLPLTRDAGQQFHGRVQGHGSADQRILRRVIWRRRGRRKRWRAIAVRTPRCRPRHARARGHRVDTARGKSLRLEHGPRRMLPRT